MHNLHSGNNKSCGCKGRRDQSTHGMSSTRFYRAWRSMIDRCTNEKLPNYKHYGGRGIKVCDEWLKFECFKEDMYENYCEQVENLGVKNTTLDRIDSSGDYCKANCRWASIVTQNINRRPSKKNTSGVIGVRFLRGKWQARASVKGRHIHLGTFDEKEDAIQARKKFENERENYYDKPVH